MVDPDYAARATAGGADRDPDLVVAEIFAGREFQAGLDRLAVETQRPRAELEREARAALVEMVAVQSELALGAVDRLGRFALRAYDIEVDSDALAALRALNRRHALVFLPSHKSYLDPFILRGALGEAGLPRNHILGGINVSFWPMGPVLRRSGVVFIRRTIKDDAVYKLTLRAYLGYLVERRYNLEWYLEGGRSRTGKLRPPRLGVLSYLVEAFRERGVDSPASPGPSGPDDLHLVPVSIAYDQLQEVAAMAAEEHGAEKKAESFAWMLQYIRSQGQRLGKAYVNFAEPISLRQVRTESKLATEKIAFEVLHRINRVTPITPTSLLTLALLGIGDRALTQAEIRSVLDPLLDYVAVRKLPQAGTVDLATPGGLRPALDALVSTRVVTRFTGGVEPVYGVGENQHLVAAYSRNRIIHFFVTRAITELVLLHLIRKPVGHPGARGTGGVPPTGAAEAANERDLGARAWAEALRLRDVLKYEFFFAAKPEFAEELRAELAILDPDWERKAADPTAIATGLAELPLLLGHRVLGSFLEAYTVVADRLAAHPPGPVDEKPFLDECIGVGRQYRLQQRIHSPESISKELFKNALSLAAGRGLLVDPGSDPEEVGDLARKREAFATELREVVDRVDSLRRLAVAALERTTAEEGPE
ncbi:MAG TPA: 1-acyl-sn-glycerol-3-phosphate acyltransferase [Acidimicrobiia bacterium]|nr:1-acyl-sn-glycerol-3-phosphate acyltransferase [Acidimicrobiia bacterium]